MCGQVKEAYRKKGWGLVLGSSFIEQCKDDHYIESIERQKGEGCRMFGHLQVNKVVRMYPFMCAGSCIQAKVLESLQSVL